MTGIAMALFALWLVYQVASSQPAYSGAGFGRTLGLHLTYGALFLGYGVWLLARRRLPTPLPFDTAVILVVLMLALSAAASINRSVSVEVVLLSGAAVLAMYALHDASLLTARRLARTLIFLAFVLAVLGLFDAGLRYSRWLEISSAVEGEFRTGHLLRLPRSGGILHPNVLAMVLNLVLPFLVLFALRPPSRFDRVLASGTLLVVMPALFLTQSRGGWLAMLACLTCIGILYLLANREDSLGMLRRLPVRPVITSAVLLTLSVTAISAITWESRPPWLFRDTVSLRQEAAAKAIEMVEDRPILGSGPNTYGLQYDAYGGRNLSSNVHPHNAYLNVLVDSGVVGMVLLLTAALIFASWLARAFLRAGRGARLWLAACAGALATLPVHALVDSPQLWNPVMLVTVIVIVIAQRVSPRELRHPTSSFRLAQRMLVAGLLPLTLLGWLLFDLPHARYQDSQALYADGSLREAAAAASDAAHSFPSSVAYHLNAGVLNGLLYEEDASSETLDQAFSHFRDALEADPNSALAYADLAQLYSRDGNNGAAVEAARLALGKAPYDPAFAAVAAVVLEDAGLIDEAVQAYGEAMRKEPRLSQSLFWQTTPQRQQLRPAVITASGADACDLGSAAVLFSAYGDDLDALLSGCRSHIAGRAGAAEDRVGLVLLLSALGHNDEALAEARKLPPNVSGAHMALGVALSSTGDLAKVRHAILADALSGNTDARLLLSYTFGADASGENQVSPVLNLIAGPEPLPASVRRMIDLTRSPAAGFARAADYFAEEKYFEIDLLRSAPAVMLLPGEWQKLISPREARFADALALR